MYTVEVDMPNLPKGGTVEIDGLGVFENGQKTEVSDDAAEAFRLKHQTQAIVTDDEGNNTVEVTPGPTLLQAFKGHDTIKVTKAKEAPTTTRPEGGDNA